MRRNLQKDKIIVIATAIVLAVVCFCVAGFFASEVFAASEPSDIHEGVSISLSSQMTYNSASYSDTRKTTSGTYYVYGTTSGGEAKISNGFVAVRTKNGTTVLCWLPLSYFKVSFSSTFCHSDSHIYYFNASSKPSISNWGKDSDKFNTITMTTSYYKDDLQANKLNFNIAYNGFYIDTSVTRGANGESPLLSGHTIAESYRWLTCSGSNVNAVRVMLYDRYKLSNELKKASGGELISGSTYAADNIYITYFSENRIVLSFIEADASGRLLYDSGFIDCKDGVSYRIHNKNTVYIYVYMKYSGDGAALTYGSDATTPISAESFGSDTQVWLWGPTIQYNANGGKLTGYDSKKGDFVSTQKSTWSFCYRQSGKKSGFKVFNSTGAKDILGNDVKNVKAANGVRAELSGYTFKNWNTEANGSGTSISSTKFPTTTNASGETVYDFRNQTLYAQYTWTITYDGGGATDGSVSSQTVALGGTAKARTNMFTKTGYVFTGWKDQHGHTYASGDTIPDHRGNLTLTAQWSRPTLTVSGDTGIASTTPSGSSIKNVGAVINVKCILNTGYKFLGWYEGDTLVSGAQSFTYTMDANNHSLVAKSELITYKQKVSVLWENANWTSEDNRWTTTNPTGDAAYNSIDADYAYGSTVSWSFPGNDTYEKKSIDSYTATGENLNKEVKVYRKTHVLTLTKDNTSISSVSDTSDYNIPDATNHKYRVGQTIKIDATVKAGYSWAKWKYTNASGNDYSTTKSTTYTMGTADATLYAYGTPNNYTITLDGNGATAAGTSSVVATFDAIVPEIDKVPKRIYTYTLNAGADATYINQAAVNGIASITVKFDFTGYFSNNWSATGGMIGYTDKTVGTQYYTEGTETKAGKGVAFKSAKWTRAEDSTLYAGWASKTITLPTVEKDDYRFDGWWTEADISADAGTEDKGIKIGMGGTVITPGSSVVLYAHWTYLGAASEIQYNKVTITETTKTFADWVNKNSVVTKFNNKMFRAYDEDGDLVSFKLYPGSHATGTLPAALASGTMSDPYTSATSPTHAEFGQSTGTYMYSTIEYDFRQTDSYNTQAEGLKTYTLVAKDSNGHEVRRVVTIKLDMTPPVLTGAEGTEGQHGNCGEDGITYTWCIVKSPDGKLDQTGSDSLSGLYRIELYTFSDQNNKVSSVASDPYRYAFDITQRFPDELGVILKCIDNAGNVAYKFIVVNDQLQIKIEPFLERQN